MNRARMLQNMAERQWDLLIIGGGISGAGVAREAALRGLNVALVEQGDFASGTSSRSGKMIIGGLRYLLNGELHLVRKGLKERDRLMRMAPHLVHHTPYLFPVWEGDPDPLWKIRLGLTLYDLLGNGGGEFSRKAFSPEEVARIEPGLRQDSLRGAAQYWDGMTDDVCLTIETLQSAVKAGAAVANYTRIVSFQKEQGQIKGATALDLIDGNSIEIKASAVLTAAGPWTDLIRRLDQPDAPPLLRLVKGSFIVVPSQRLPVSRNVTLRAADRRMTFAVPFRHQTYIGTTETDYTGDPAKAAPNRADVDYLLAAANTAFPKARLTPGDLISAWAGLRPLVGARPGQNPSEITRDYTILKTPSGLSILAGGKLTGFRAMGEHVIDSLFPATRGLNREASLAPLPGATEPLPGDEAVAHWAEKTQTPKNWLLDTARTYGCQFQQLAEEMPANLKGREAWLLAQTRFAVKYQMAQRLSDVLRRRANIMLFEPGNGLERAPAVADAMAGLLQWTLRRQTEELRQYALEVAASQFIS